MKTLSTFWKQYTIAILLFSFVFCNVAAAEEDSSLKVGAIVSLTGELASVGTEIQRGIELARQEALMTGDRIEVLYEDDQSLNSSSAVSAAHKLININHVDIALTPWIEQSRIVAPVFTRAKTPLVVLWDSNSSIQKSSPYLFSNGFSTEQAGNDMAAFAAQKLGKTRAAIIQQADPWAEIISHSFAESFVSNGGKITFRQEVLPGEVDFKTLIAQMKRSGAHAVFFPLLPPSNLAFVRHMKQLAPKMELLTGDAFLQEIVKEAGDSAEGVYLSNIHSSKSSKLRTMYLSRFGREPADLATVSCGYDGLLRVLAIHKNSVRNQNSLYTSLLSDFGASRSADRRQLIYQVTDGVRRLVHQ